MVVDYVKDVVIKEKDVITGKRDYHSILTQMNLLIFIKNKLDWEIITLVNYVIINKMVGNYVFIILIMIKIILIQKI